MVGLDLPDLDRLLKGYSHGMKNKMQMLCLLISKPPIILLDEPLKSLDVVAAYYIIVHSHFAAGTGSV